VATQVFGRGEDFNQATDPIVSIQANKLRRALERYYLVAGQNDPSASRSPKAPMCRYFAKHATIKGSSHSKKDERPIRPCPCVADDRGSVVREPDRQPGLGISGDRHRHRNRPGNHPLPGNPRAAADTRGGQRRASDTGARFVLCGAFKPDVLGLKVIVSLVDSVDGNAHLGGFLSNGSRSRRVDWFEERIASTVVSKISCEYGIIAKALSPESKQGSTRGTHHPPSDTAVLPILTTFQR
jgi:adenylate cyclase